MSRDRGETGGRSGPSARTGLTPRERIHRVRARAWTLQILYRHESDNGETPLHEVFDQVARTRRIADERVPYIRRLLDILDEHGDEIDETLSRFTRNWRLDRLSRIDRSVLRIGAAEILHADDVPGPVAIQEAVRLVGRYGGDESAGFVNGVLDAVYRSCDSSS